MEFLLGVGLFGKDTCWSKLILGDRSGGSECFQGAGEIQVEPEEGVMGERPEGWVGWGLRVTPQESTACWGRRAGHFPACRWPRRTAATEQCATSSPSGVQPYISSFVLLFSQ